MVAEVDYGSTDLLYFQLQDQALPFDGTGFQVALELYPVGVAAWTADTAYAQGDLVRPAIGNGHVYLATTGGTSDALTEPTFPTTPAGTVVDGTVTWTEITPQAAWQTAVTGVVEITGAENLPRDTSYRARYRVTAGVGSIGYFPNKNRYDVWRVQDVMAH